MKKFTAIFSILFLAIFLLLVLNIDFISSVIPGWHTANNSFWDFAEVIIVGVLLLFTLSLAVVIMMLMRLCTLLFRK